MSLSRSVANMIRGSIFVKNWTDIQCSSLSLEHEEHKIIMFSKVYVYFCCHDYT